MRGQAGWRRVRKVTAERSAQVVTSIFALAALLTFYVFATTHLRHERPSPVVTILGAVNIPGSGSFTSLVLLVLITKILLSRKRFGLWVVGGIQVVGAGFSIIAVTGLNRWPTTTPWLRGIPISRPGDVISLVVAPLTIGWLWFMRDAFRAKLVPGSWTRAILVLVSGSTLTMVATMFLLRATKTPTHLVLHRAVETVQWSLDSDEGRGLFFHGVPGWLPRVTSVLLGFTLLTAVIVFIRTATQATAWSPEREIALRELVARYGQRDSLGYFATRRDKSSIFSADGQAAITYRVLFGVSLASGDPIGRRASWESAIASWRDEARAYGWQPAVLSASEEGARAYVAAGLRAMSMGDEAILDPDRFDIHSRAMAPVRHAVGRIARAGIVVKAGRQRDVDPALRATLTEKAERWRGDEPERGFSMALNRPDDPADGDNLVIWAEYASGKIAGLLTFVPWGQAGASLDVMRRDPEAPNGVTEAMVAYLLEHSREFGVARVSLNFCMFRQVYADAARLGSTPLTRINHSVLGFLDRYWQFERLYVSNEKYLPTWSPRYACYRDTLSLLPVGVAAGLAEGFIPQPSFARSSPALSPVLDARELDQLSVPRPDPIDHPRHVRYSDQTEHRLVKLAAVAQSGMDAYPVGGGHDRPAPALSGRIIRIRDHGGVVFADVGGARSTHQVVLETGTLGRDEVRRFTQLVASGDLLEFDGQCTNSRSGSPVLLVSAWRILAKALHPLPFRGGNDPAKRGRNRVTDLIVNPEGMAALRHRSAAVRSLRSVLDSEGYLEVETPVLQRIHGGATARPFRTFSNAYHCDLTLRIAPELYLKRLVVGGTGPVYELGRNFRNEGVDSTHNPEFTALEAYLPRGDYTDMRRLTQRLIRAAATAVHGSPVLPLPDGDSPDSAKSLHDISIDWPVVPVLTAVSAAVGQPITLDTELGLLHRLAARHGVRAPVDSGPGQLIESLYGDLVEPNTTFPTFYVDFPAETSPLARPHRSVPGLAERWDLVVNGAELATAYSELTDPLEQRRRLTAQSIRAARGDVEAMELDEDFLFDLELGMPPCGGLGIGVDRLVMLLLGKSIRAVLTFPFVKPVGR